MSQKFLSSFLLIGTRSALRAPTVFKGHQRNRLISVQLVTHFSTKHLTPHVTLMTNASIKHLKSTPNLSKYSSEGRSLAVLLCWLGATNNAINKYVQFYTDQGFDVLTFKTTPLQMLLPALSVSSIRTELLPTLLTSDHQKKLIHGFSVGGFVYGQMLKYFNNDPTGKYQHLVNTITAQVWDSVVDIQGTSIGVSKTLFPNSQFLQKCMHNYIDLHQKIFYSVATKYYLGSRYQFYKRPLKLPTLFLASEIDPIGTINVVHDLERIWGSYGMTCSSKVWSDTTHVGHMKRYPEEYKATLKTFLDKYDFNRGARILRDKEEEDLASEVLPNVVYSESVKT